MNCSQTHTVTKNTCQIQGIYSQEKATSTKGVENRAQQQPGYVCLADESRNRTAEVVL